MSPIYCISGMGADGRIFKNLKISGYELVPVPWPPFDKTDSLPSYAQKISKLIPGEKPIILGLSLGGMLAIEIGKLRPTEKIILISSAKTTADLPKIGRVSLAEALLDLIPEFVFRSSRYTGFNFAGAKTKEEKALMAEMMKDSAPGFFKFALKAVIRWHNTAYPPDVIQLHGTADKIIPPQNVHPDYWVTGGSHIMIYNRATEVGKIISDYLSR